MEQKRKIPRAAALHDLSCFGRCALTVIDPVLSALGVQCVPIPTALLSTHTGGFRNMYFCELDHAIPRIADHLEAEGVRFDAVYTGFLGSARQAEVIKDFITRFGTDDGTGGTPTVLVDPVLGDDGELYHTCTPELAAAMTELSAMADVITPNITEACLMAGLRYDEVSRAAASEPAGVCTELCRTLLQKIGGGRLHCVIITGVHCRDEIATVTLDASGAEEGVSVFTQPRIGSDYPGTGDIFASVLLGGMLKGKAPKDAAADASRFAALCVQRSTVLCPDEAVRNGVALEPLLGELSERNR